MSKRGRKPTRGDGWELIQARSREAQNVKRIHSDAPGDHSLVVRAVKRKGGKVVTVAEGFRLNAKDLKKLAKKLKASCASGGTATEETIEVQGRHVEKVVELLTAAGYPARAK